MPGGPAGPSGVVFGRGVIDSAKNLIAFFQVQSIQLVRQTAASEFTLCTPLPLVLFLFMALAEIIPFDQASQSGKPTSHGPAATDMRSDLVEQASRLIPHPPMLINVVSQRVRQLNQGRSPMVDLTGRPRTEPLMVLLGRPPSVRKSNRDGPYRQRPAIVVVRG